MQQIEIADCHDEKIPAWWVVDGRYELAWPHPCLLFTFILGDVDFHGDKVDIDFKDGEAANYISPEGVLDGIEVMSGENGEINNKNKILDLNNYLHFFYSKKIDVENLTSLHFPLVKGYGTPPGLVDRGSLKFPLSGNMRIHEVHLWNVSTKKEANETDIGWQLPYQDDLSGLDLRYADAFLKLKCPEERIKLHRFSSLKVEIPSKENIAVQLMLVKNIKRAATLPDLTIHPVRDVRQDGDKLMVTVHNIGDGDAKKVQIEVTGSDGKAIAKRVIPAIEAPINLVPVTETVEFDLAG